MTGADNTRLRIGQEDDRAIRCHAPEHEARRGGHQPVASSYSAVRIDQGHVTSMHLLGGHEPRETFSGCEITCRPLSIQSPGTGETAQGEGAKQPAVRLKYAGADECVVVHLEAVER